MENKIKIVDIRYEEPEDLEERLNKIVIMLLSKAEEIVKKDSFDKAI